MSDFKLQLWGPVYMKRPDNKTTGKWVLAGSRLRMPPCPWLHKPNNEHLRWFRVLQLQATKLAWVVCTFVFKKCWLLWSHAPFYAYACLVHGLYLLVWHVHYSILFWEGSVNRAWACCFLSPCCLFLRHVTPDKQHLREKEHLQTPATVWLAVSATKNNQSNRREVDSVVGLMLFQGRHSSS